MSDSPILKFMEEREKPSEIVMKYGGRGRQAIPLSHAEHERRRGRRDARHYPHRGGIDYDPASQESSSCVGPAKGVGSP